MKNKFKTKNLVSFALALVCAFSFFGIAPIKADAATSYTIKINTSSYDFITNVSSGYNLNPYTTKGISNNTNCTTWPKYTQGADQYMHLQKVGDGYEIYSKLNTAYRVNCYGTSIYNGQNINFWKRTGDITQRFVIMYEPAYNAFTIRSAKNTTLCLTQASNSAGANISLQTYKYGNKNQLWKSSLFTATKTTTTTSTSSASTSGLNTKSVEGKTFYYLPIKNPSGYSFNQYSSMYTKAFNNAGCMAMSYALAQAATKGSNMYSPLDYWNGSGAFAAHGVSVTRYSSGPYSQAQVVSALVQGLNKGKAGMVYFVRNDNGGHWVAAIGLTSNAKSIADILVIDPADGTYCSLQKAYSKYKGGKSINQYIIFK